MADLVSIGFKADAKGIDDVNKGFDKVVASGGRADKVLKNTEKSITKFSGAAAKTTDKMSMFGRQSGQAGIQLQQFIGQVQGGQSAMLALSQQSADLGFVLGAPLLGAVVGISASIAGMLLPNLFKATEGIIGLDDSLSFLEGNYKKLSEAQKLVAKDVVSAKLKEQQVQANGLRVEINKLQTALMIAEQSAGGRFLERLFGEDVDKASKALAEAEGSLSTLNLKIEKTKKQVTDLSLAQDKQPVFPDMPTRGLFSIIRQPIYVSFALTLWTVPVWTPDQLALAMVFTTYCLFAPKFKEARFEKRYGTRFRAYRARVPYAVPCLKRSKYHDNNSTK